MNTNIHHKHERIILQHSRCMHESMFGYGSFKKLSESLKIHNYNDASLTPIVEHEATTCFSKECSSLLCQAWEAKAKSLKVLFLRHVGLFIINGVTFHLLCDSWAPSWLLSSHMTLELPSDASTFHMWLLDFHLHSQFYYFQIQKYIWQNCGNNHKTKMYMFDSSFRKLKLDNCDR